MITSKLIPVLTIIGLLNFQANLVMGQTVTVAITSSNGVLSPGLSSSSAGIGFGLPPLLNNLYQHLGTVSNGFTQQFLPVRAVTNEQNLYNFNNQGNIYGHQKKDFQGYNYDKPNVNIHQQLGQWPAHNRNTNNNYNVHRPNSNFFKNPPTDQMVLIGAYNRPQQFQSPNTVPNKVQTDFVRNPDTENHNALPIAYNPSWNTKTPNPKIRLEIIKSQYFQDGEIVEDPFNVQNTQHNSETKLAAVPQNVNNFQDGLISEIAEDPLNVKNTKHNSETKLAAVPKNVNNFQDGLISEIAEDPLNVKNTQHNSETKLAAVPENVNNFQDGLISEIAEDPLNVKNTQHNSETKLVAVPENFNNFQDGLISEIAEDPLNIKNTQHKSETKLASVPENVDNFEDGLISEIAEDSLNVAIENQSPSPPLSSSQNGINVNNFLDNLISEVVKDPPSKMPLFKPETEILNQNNILIASTTTAPFDSSSSSASSKSHPDKLQPGTIINADSPYYSAIDSIDLLSSLIDVRMD